VPQQLSRSVQIFGAEGSVGDAIASSWRVLEVLGVPHPAIVVSELLAFTRTSSSVSGAVFGRQADRHS